uniref:BST-2 n=1 Tax=Artibeus jamaicensis TaxID=9417 RepID=A0A8F3BZI6_ARTJA|nr:BST-2 [Artibeus jamaicensis]
MTSTFYHYTSLPSDENSREQMQGHYKIPLWLSILLALLGTGLVVAMALAIIFYNQAHSLACMDGFKMEQECQNVTNSLKSKLAQTQEILLKTEAQAATYNQTAVTLMASLKVEQAQGQMLQKQVQELQKEIKTLKQNLQDTTQKLQDTTQKLNQLRKDHESSGPGKGPTDSGNTLSLSMISMLLTLSLLDLLA